MTDRTERVHVEIRLCLTVEQATAAFVGFPDSPYCLLRNEEAANQATADQAGRALAALIIEHGMAKVRRETEELPELEQISRSDARVIATCRALVNRHLTIPHTEEECH